MRTFTRKTNRVNGVGGDKVRAADVNELQQAIEDIQDGTLPTPGAVDAANTFSAAGGMLLSDGQVTHTVFGADGLPIPAAVDLLVEAFTRDAVGIGGGGAVTSVNGQTGAIVVGETYHNVSTHGIIGDDATDQSTAIAAMMDDISAGTVYFPAGIYLGRFSLDKDHINWRGEGRSSAILKVPDGVDAPAATLTITGDDTGVYDLMFDGNKGNQDFTGLTKENLQESDGVNIYSSNVVVHHCYIKDCASHGIIVWDVGTTGGANASRSSGIRQYHHITENIVENNGTPVNQRAAIDLALGADARRSIISGNIVIGGDDTHNGVTLHGGVESIISDNIIVISSALDCIRPHTGGFTTIQGNVGLSNGGRFISTSAGGVDGLVITGNYAGPLDGGVGMIGFATLDGDAANILIGDNYFHTTRSNGEFVLLSGVDNVLINGNLMRATSGVNTTFLRVDDTQVGHGDVRLTRANLRIGVSNDYRLESGADLTGVTFEGVNDMAAALADTSGATLGDLEIEVNELKAILRTHNLLDV